MKLNRDYLTMKRETRHTKQPLPYIPNDAEFIVYGHYGKIVDNILHLYRNTKWYSTDQTFEEYSTYLVKEPHELTPFEVVAKSNIRTYNYRNIYFFKDHHGRYQMSYNKPVLKGKVEVKGVMVDKIKAGETFSVSDYYTNIIKWIDRYDYYVDLDTLIKESEIDYLQNGGLDLKTDNVDFKVTNEFYYKIMGIELVEN